MNGWIKTSLLGLVVLGIAACGTEPAEPAAEAPMVEEPAEAPMAEGALAEEAPMTASDQAQANCLAAVAEQVGVDAGTLTVLSADVSEAGTSVMIEVPEATAPWSCVVDTDGSTVVDVFFTGDEGGL